MALLGEGSRGVLGCPLEEFCFSFKGWAFDTHWILAVQYFIDDGDVPSLSCSARWTESPT